MPSVRSTDPAVQPSVAATMKPKMNITPATMLVKIVVPTGWPVRVGGEGVGQESDGQEDRGNADVDQAPARSSARGASGAP